MEIKEEVKDAVTEEKEDDFGAAFAEDSNETGSEEKKEEPTTSETEGKEQVETETSESGTAAVETESEKTDGEIDWKAPDAVEKARKVVEDNKSWTTKVTQENAELKARLKALEDEAEKAKAQKPAEKTETAQTPDVPEEVKSFLDDYPELKPTVDYLAGQMLKDALGGIDLKQFAELRQRDQDQIGQLLWERHVTNGFIDEDGTVIEGHPDMPQIVRTKVYHDWIKEKKYDKDEVDPKTAIARLTEYKEQVLKKSASVHDDKVKTDAEKINATMSGSVKSGPSPRAPAKKDAGSFSEGFKDD